MSVFWLKLVLANFDRWERLKKKVGLIVILAVEFMIIGVTIVHVSLAPVCSCVHTFYKGPPHVLERI